MPVSKFLVELMEVGRLTLNVNSHWMGWDHPGQNKKENAK